jgi:hypothetical protein
MEGCDSSGFFFQFSHVAPKVVIKPKKKKGLTKKFLQEKYRRRKSRNPITCW